jgi:hypothetical protein
MTHLSLLDIVFIVKVHVARVKYEFDTFVVELHQLVEVEHLVDLHGCVELEQWVEPCVDITLAVLSTRREQRRRAG